MGLFDFLPWKKKIEVEKPVVSALNNYSQPAKYYYPPGGFGEKSDSALSYDPIRGNDYYYLQHKARLIYWDSLQARSIMNQKKVLAINSGLRLESQPEINIVNISEEQKTIWTENIESRWRVWKKLKEVDVTERRNFSQLEAMAFLSFVVLNEVFLIFRYSAEHNRSNPLNVQILPPHMVQDPSPDKITKSKNKIIDGIEIDKFGREVAIWVFHEEEVNNDKKYQRIPVKGKESGKTFVVHGFISDDPGQYRGIPDLAPIYHNLKKIACAEDNEINTMAINSSIAGAIERDEDVVKQDKLSGIGKVGFGGTVEERADNEADEERPKKYEERKIQGGSYWVQNLEKGEKIKEFDTKRPNINIPDFIDRIMNYLAPALGMPLSIVKMMFGQNYSASKAELELGWANLNYIISEFVSYFNQPIYEAWADGEVSKGTINAQNWNDKTTRAAWLNASWNGLPIPSLNPLQEAKASESLINNGLTNREHEAQKRTGTTFSQNVARLVGENEKLAIANNPGNKLENAGGQEDGNTEQDTN